MPEEIPIDKVLQMRTQGLSNSQIIEQLEREGYTPNQIFDAMNQADMKSSVTKAPTPEQFGVQNPMMESVQTPQDASIGMEQPTINPEQNQAILSQTTTEPGEVLDVETEKIEEVAEAIIDEKWQDFVDTINKVIEWKENMEKKIVQMESQIKDLKDQFSQLQKGTLDKMAEYDEHVTDIGTEIKAMEAVFKKILPTLTENVTQLSNIVKDLKEKV